LFLQYDKAGGQVLPGLVSRRTQEAMWIGAPQGALGAGDVASAERGVSVGASSNRIESGATDRLHAMVAAPSGSVTGSSGVRAGQTLAATSDSADSLLDDDSDRTYQAGFSVMRRGGRPELTAAAMLLMHGTLAKLGPRTQDKG
jgi:lysozyme